MNFIYAFWFDYPLVPVFVCWTLGAYLFWFGYEYLIPDRRVVCNLIAVCCFLSVCLFYGFELDQKAIQTPQATFYYIHEFQGKDERVAFCFKRFGEQNTAYADFMSKCLTDDWRRFEYESLTR